MFKTFFLIVITGILIFSNLVNSVSAQEAILTSKDPKTKINLRNNPSINAGSVGYGTVGDKVTILNRQTGDRGYTWYQVKFAQTGTVGWVRGDFIKLLKTDNNNNNTDNKQPEKTTTTSPQLPNEALKICQNRTAAEFKTQASNVELISYSTDDKGIFLVKLQVKKTTKTANCQVNNKAKIVGFSSQTQTESITNNSEETSVIAFQTDNHSVKIYQKDGKLYLNIFNKNTSTMTVNSVLIETASTATETGYWYKGDLSYHIAVDTKGQKWLTISGFGENIREKGY